MRESRKPPFGGKPPRIEWREPEGGCGGKPPTKSPGEWREPEGGCGGKPPTKREWTSPPQENGASRKGGVGGSPPQKENGPLSKPELLRTINVMAFYVFVLCFDLS